MSVSAGGSAQSGPATSPTSSWASVAGSAARASASAAATSAPTCSGVVALPDIEPAAGPPACRTNDTTAMSMRRMAPFVVRVLLAQRRLALVVWWAITMQSSAVETASACSTSSWTVAVVVAGISGPPRRRC